MERNHSSGLASVKRSQDRACGHADSFEGQFRDRNAVVPEGLKPRANRHSRHVRLHQDDAKLAVHVG